MTPKILPVLLLFCLGKFYAQTPCNNGSANGYPCSGITLQSYISSATMGAAEAQDSWGWTDPQTGKEYAIVALDNGTAFVDISNPASPIYLGRLNTQTASSLWRDVKVYNNYAYIVSDANGSHGMQIFNLTKLRNVNNPPVNFTRDGLYTGIGSAHNVIINEDSGYLYILGSNRNSGGPRIMNLSNPTNPTVAGNISAYGYCHDAQVVIYDGPDPDYQGKEIMVGSFSGSDFVRVLDVTNKSNISQISSISYSNKYYTHQGWFTEDKRFFIVGDEVDEENVGFNTRTLVFDMQDLDNPVLHYTHYGNTPAIDHNGYVRGNRFYLANYAAGMRIMKVNGLYNQSPSLSEVNYFDMYPSSNAAAFNGTWNVYPFFESGNLIATGFGNGGINGDGGLFILKDPNYDNIAPNVSCKNITLSLDHLGNPVTISAADVDDNSNDNFGITSLTIDKTTFTIDDIGENTVTLTAEDDYGNVSSCPATVTVTDYIPVDFIYDNNSWTPNVPYSGSNPSNFKDVVKVLSGTTTLTANTVSKTVAIDPGAVLNISNATLSVAGDISNLGTLSTSNGTLELIGNTTQTISGNALEVDTFILTGAATVALNTPLAIANLLRIDNGTLETNDQLTFKSTYNSGIHKTGVIGPVQGTISGKVTTERFIPAKRAYRLMSSPVNTATTIRQNWQENGNNTPGLGTHISGTAGSSNGFDVSGSNNPSLYKVNTAAQQYEPIPYTNGDATLSAGESFLMFIRGDRTIDLFSNASPATNTTLRTTGTLHVGTVNITDLSVTTNGSSLIGNPYQAPIDMGKVLAATNNVNPRYFHVYDPTLNTRGAFVTVDAQTNSNSLLGGGASGSDANKFVQPGQAFFVNTIANGPASLSISENDKDVSGIGTNVFEPIVSTGQDSRISIKLFAGTSISEEDKPLDGALIFMEPGQNSGYDVNDAFKSLNFDENLAVDLSGVNVSIDRRDVPNDEESIPLNISEYRHTQYTFQIETDNLHSHFQAYLYDAFLETSTLLANTGTTLVSFEVSSGNASTAADRFSIVFDRILEITDANLGNFITVAPNPVKSILYIESPEAKIEKVEVFDIRGRRMAKELEEKQYAYQIDLSSLRTAVYFVKITTEFGSATKKIIKE